MIPKKITLPEFLERKRQEGNYHGAWENENPYHVSFPKALFEYVPVLKVGNPFRSFAVIGGAGSGKSESVSKENQDFYSGKDAFYFNLKRQVKTALIVVLILVLVSVIFLFFA